MIEPKGFGSQIKTSSSHKGVKFHHFGINFGVGPEHHRSAKKIQSTSKLWELIVSSRNELTSHCQPLGVRVKL